MVIFDVPDAPELRLDHGHDLRAELPHAAVPRWLCRPRRHRDQVEQRFHRRRSLDPLGVLPVAFPDLRADFGGRLGDQFLSLWVQEVSAKHRLGAGERRPA